MFDKSCAQEIRKECWLVSCGWVTLFTCADCLLKKLSNYSMNKDNGFEKVENVFIIVIVIIFREFVSFKFYVSFT